MNLFFIVVYKLCKYLPHITRLYCNSTFLTCFIPVIVTVIVRRHRLSHRPTVVWGRAEVVIISIRSPQSTAPIAPVSFCRIDHRAFMTMPLQNWRVRTHVIIFDYKPLFTIDSLWSPSLLFSQCDKKRLLICWFT